MRFMTAKFLKTIFSMILAILVLSAVPALASEDLRPELKINRDNGDSCVEPVEIMRKDHIKFLLHKRDETMREGIRTKKYSLKECVNCHANKDDEGKYIPVNAPGEFCSSCHTYTSIKLDCFECHATTPREGTTWQPAKPDAPHKGAAVGMPDKQTTTN